MKAVSSRINVSVSGRVGLFWLVLGVCSPRTVRRAVLPANASKAGLPRSIQRTPARMSPHGHEQAGVCRQGRRRPARAP